MKGKVENEAGIVDDEEIQKKKRRRCGKRSLIFQKVGPEGFI